MELRHLRYFVAVGEEQPDSGFGGGSWLQTFERLPRGVELSAAGTQFLQDARRILQEVNEATGRAGRVARGHSGTLRVGFAEKCVLARRCSGFLPAIPGAAT
jgi:DNA-binding transcriptional LysR family regulator